MLYPIIIFESKKCWTRVIMEDQYVNWKEYSAAKLGGAGGNDFNADSSYGERMRAYLKEDSARHSLDPEISRRLCINLDHVHFSRGRKCTLLILRYLTGCLKTANTMDILGGLYDDLDQVFLISGFSP